MADSERPGVLAVLEVDELEIDERDDRDGDEVKPRWDAWV